ncbi:MAG: hypothetical protein IJT34_09765 [Butyrivibrio sp.]|nr:hypothetical protein [Butyrivibrio sp.]
MPKTAKVTKATVEASASRKTRTAAAAAVETAADNAGTAAVIAAPEESVMDVIYQSNAQILDRAAAPNERFAIGDAMPVYYL